MQQKTFIKIDKTEKKQIFESSKDLFGKEDAKPQILLIREKINRALYNGNFSSEDWELDFLKSVNEEIRFKKGLLPEIK
jgi:hypothetical protein